MKISKKSLISELGTSESWVEHGYAKHFDVSYDHVNDTVERIHVKDVSPDEFIRRFEKPYKPVVICGAQDGLLFLCHFLSFSVIFCHILSFSVTFSHF